MDQNTKGDPTYDTSLALHVPPDAWEPSGNEGDPWARILTTVWINTVPFHLEGVAVVSGPDGIQNASDPEWEDTLGALSAIDNPDGPWHVVTLRKPGMDNVERERDYVLHAEPF